MGCATSKDGGNKQLTIDITGADLHAPCHREVKVNDMYNGRLDTVDYEKIIAEGKPWIDETFGPETGTSLIDRPKEIPRKRRERFETFVWKRPSEVWDGPFSVYDTIEPDDMKQGILQDCYFASALSSIAEYPERIRKMFLTKEVNSAGCYAVQLFIDG